jgi:hypothetical protein
MTEENCRGGQTINELCQLVLCHLAQAAARACDTSIRLEPS